MNENQNPLIKKSIVEYDTFTLEIPCKNSEIDREVLARKFKLDVEYYEDKNGLFVTQGDKFVKKPYELTDSTRKINEQISSIPQGFTKTFFADSQAVVVFEKPPQPIPKGCYCTIDACGKIGPMGHSETCSYPNPLSLNLTLQGFIDCVYSNNKIFRKKLDGNESIRDIIEKFTNLVDEYEEKNEDEDGEMTKEEIYIMVASMLYEDEENEFKLLSKGIDENDKDINKIFTNIRYQNVKNITGLKKSKLNYFYGATMLQHFSISDDGTPKKSSIRVYHTGDITITPCIWDEKQSYKKMIIDAYKRIEDVGEGMKIIPVSAFISVACGRFRLTSEASNKGINLDSLYKIFNPVDKTGNKVDQNEYMKKIVYVSEDGNEQPKTFVQEDKNRYHYTISEANRGKISMSFIKYDKDDNPSSYKVTVQIFNSGVVQLIFTYSDDESKVTEKEIINTLEGSNDIYTQVEIQKKTIKNYFEMIRKLLVSLFDKMFNNGVEIFREKDDNEKSDKIYNTVTGFLPYGKRVGLYAGFVVDIFNDENDDWEDNNWWSPDDSDRGIVVNAIKTRKPRGKRRDRNEDIYEVVIGKPTRERIVETDNIIDFNIKNKSSLPLVKLQDGREAYLVENYQEGKEKHYVIIGPVVRMTMDDVRVYKKSIHSELYKGDTQVCTKTSGGGDKKTKGVEIRPTPYSFYGTCPSMNYYIDPIGKVSRKDNRFYPTCVKIDDKNKKEIKERTIDFILNGFDEEQYKDARINTDVEYYFHGVPLSDKYSGTFKPGTTDIGNEITFWDENIQSWNTGYIAAAKKSHGPGNDLNHVIFHVKTNDSEGLMEIKGEQFHPRYREKRNFPGINNLFSDEESKKEFLIECIKDLHIIKPEIEIKKSDKNTRLTVMNELKNLCGKTFKTITKTDPFIKENINNFSKIAYEAVLIPDYSIRCILFIIDENNQYLINSDKEVRKIFIDFEEDVSETIIDGFINESDFYPFDILYKNGVKMEEDYIYEEDHEQRGRLIELQSMTESVNSVKAPNSIAIKKPLGTKSKKISVASYIGPIDEDVSLLEFVKRNMKPGNDILFVPQKGNFNYMIWNHIVPNQPIVGQLSKKASDENNEWYIGMTEVIGDIKTTWKLLPYPLVMDKSNKIKDADENLFTPKKGDYIKFTINILKNGTINTIDPYINVIKVSEEELKSPQETKTMVRLISKPIKASVFENSDVWDFINVKKIFVAGVSSRLPLVEKVSMFQEYI